MNGDTPAATTAGTGWKLERRVDFVDSRERRHENVDVLRAFPVSAPAGPVAIVAEAGDAHAPPPPNAQLPAAGRWTLSSVHKMVWLQRSCGLTCHFSRENTRFSVNDRLATRVMLISLEGSLPGVNP